MGVWVDSLSAILLDATLAATVLFSLAALGLVGCRQPVRRVYLARTTLVCSLLLLPVVAFSPLPRIPLGRLVRGIADVGDALSAPVEPEQPGAVAPDVPEPAWPARWMGATRRVLPRPGAILVPLYAAGVATGLAWLTLGYAGLAWIRRSARAPSAETAAFYERIPWSGKRARPCLRVTERVSRPVLVGTIRPLILIPGPLDRPEVAEPLRLSLLHELAHAECCDPLFSLIGRLAQTFWFFLPPAWWIRAQLALDHEFLADRRAASKFGHLPSYASALLGMASPGGDGVAIRTHKGAMALTGSALVQRVLMLVQCPFPVESRPPLWWVWLLPALLVPATLAGASLRFRLAAATAVPEAAGTTATVREQTFRLPRLTIPPKPAGSQGRAPLFELPVRLPAAFDLSVQVWGTPSTLAATRVVGLRLGGPGSGRHASETPPSWHLVQIHRESVGARVRLAVDDHPIPLDPDQDVITTWLSVEPAPDREAQFQHLKLSW